MSVEKATEAHREGNLEAAEQGYRDALRENPQDHKTLHLLSLVLIDANRLDEALTTVEKAIELDESSGEYFQTLAVIQHRKGNLGGAVANMEQAVQNDPNLPHGHNTLGYLQLLAGDLNQAESTLRIAVRLDPESPAPCTNLGMVLMAKGDLSDARTELNRALSIDENFLPARAGLGEVFLAEGAHAFAIECFRRCHDAQPEHPQFIALLGSALVRNGELEEAQDLLDASLDAHPGNPDLLAAAGEAAIATGKPRLASNYLQQALTRRRGHMNTLTLLAEAHILLSDHVSVVRLLERLVTRPNARPGLTAKLARSKAALGETGAAIDMLRNKLADTPDSVDETLALMDLLATGNDAQAAIEVADAAPESVRTHSSIMIARSRLLLVTGETEKASSELDQVIRPGDLGFEHRYLTALAAHRSGRHAEALQQWSDLGDDVKAPSPTLPEQDTTEGLPTEPISDGRGEPLFLVGLPGSGVRAVAGALMNLNNVDILADRLTADPRHDFLFDRRQTIDASDEDQLRRLRRRYWTTLEHHRNKLQAGVAGVDLLPCTLMDLPRIAKVFPKAAIGIVERSATDTVLHGKAFGWRDGEATTQSLAQAFTEAVDNAESHTALEVHRINFDQLRDGNVESVEALLAARNVTITDFGVALAAQIVEHDGLERYLPAGAADPS